MKNDPNKQGFLNHINTIRSIETDKDTFLKAARLERHESREQPLTAKDKVKITAMFCMSLIFIAVLTLGYLSGSFVPALIGVGFIGFIAMILVACD